MALREIPAGQSKLRQLHRSLSELRLEALVVSHLPNLRYLFGFTGTTGLALVTPEASFLFLDSRYTLQGQEETIGCTIEPALPSPDEALAAKTAALRLLNVGIEASHLTLQRFEGLRGRFRKRVQIQFTNGLVEELRIVKTVEEIKEIQTVLDLTTQAFAAIIPAVKPGIREKDLAAELEFQVRKRGARKMSFETIVASGPRSALPHGLASDKILQNNEFVVFDFGAYRSGYASDVTRTVFLGRPDSEQRKIYNTVLEAVKRAEDATHSGLASRTVDQLAREHIQRAGYGGFFGHGTGHGIGLEVHEAPFISPRQSRRIRSDMVFTVEPGIYLPDKGGVRIEDIVRVRPNGCEVLTHYPRDLMVL